MTGLNVLTIMGREAVRWSIYGRRAPFRRPCDVSLRLATPSWCGDWGRGLGATMALLFPAHLPFSRPKFKFMAERRLISSEDLALIKDCYEIPSNLLQGFRVAPMRITPHSWKIIQAVPWFWKERLPEPVSASAVGLEDHQRLALMYLQELAFAGSLRASTHLAMPAALASSSPGAERKQERKKHLRKRAHLSAEELVREGTDLQTTIALSLEVAPVAMSEALAESNHAKMMDSASASPLEGIFVAARGSHSAGPVSAGLPSSPEGPSRSLFLKGAPQVIDLKEEGGPAPSVSIGEPKLFASERLELEAAEKDISLLRRQVTFLGSREAKLLSECEAAWAEAAWLWAELEASQVEEGDVRSLAIVEYLHSDIYRRQEEYKRSHYSQSGYVRALVSFYQMLSSSIQA
ncbi:hypothetical protein ACLOJK_019717 [Asimina triloba]